MKHLKNYFFMLAAVVFAVAFSSCKAKKMAAKPVAPVTTTTVPVEEKTQPVQAEEKKEEPAPVAEQTSFNFNNIQFEFDSAILKTFSYPILDEVARAMRQHPDVKMLLNGHSSQEGTAQHNMSLSVDRANAVKSYLVNAGVDGANLTVKGYGETKPIASNDTDEGRAKNRRVEFRKID